jgi:hypothetical protein
MAGDIKVDLGALISGAGTLAKDLRSAITGEISPEKKAELEIKAQEIEAQIMTAQTAINQEEAKSSSRFVSGWRPAIGWVGVIGLGFVYILKPLIEWILVLCGSSIKLPSIDIGELYPILIGMLGLGTLRTVEKTRGVASK